MEYNLPWFILLCPLISVAVILLLTRKDANLSALVSVIAVGCSFLASVVTFLGPNLMDANQISWINLGPEFHVPIGLAVDELTKVMLLVVTGVGLLVHIYSLVYMKDDAGKARFFGGLSLFMFSMLGIVLADNFVMMFIFWELVGVSSYLLIGHWFTRASAADAAKKAFISNRIGDFGFMIGILMVWHFTGSFGFAEVHTRMGMFTNAAPYLTVASLCLFSGAVGKSAQFPLHVWLPDAMEGPTPVSALIHAATMVAAGVYMLCRIFFLIGKSPDALLIIAWTGTITAVLAALMATQQDDIKRVLAYSTLSQLGYMVMAVGLGAPDAAMFHLYTHAFFKALLFLGAGAVIHALHHEQDMWKMGGLRKTMPVTFWTFIIGTLALTGCPLLAGSFSKEAILMQAWNVNRPIFLLGLGTAFLTAYYMTRLVVVAFLGKPRSHAAEHGHDGPAAMTYPLIILACLSVVAGWQFVSGFFFGAPFVSRLEEIPHVSLVPMMAIMVFLVGGVFGYALYARAATEPLRGALAIFRHKFYLDELYGAIIAGTQDLLARILGWIDKWIIDGLFVRGLSGAVWLAGFALRLFQFGNLQGYAFLFGFGVVALIYVMVFSH